MTNRCACLIEFIGGAYDGHVERFPTDAEQLPEDLIWLVSENVFRLLDGKSHGPKKTITSIAVYERQRRQGAWFYVFVGAMSPRQFGERCSRGDFEFVRSART